MIVPTAGRIVWYRAFPREGIIVDRDRPLAAIVVGVHDDGRVNLCVFGFDGTQHVRPRVYLEQEGEPAPGACCWMPFQKGQAAKLDELQRKPTADATIRTKSGAEVFRKYGETWDEALAKAEAAELASSLVDRASAVDPELAGKLKQAFVDAAGNPTEDAAPAAEPPSRPAPPAATGHEPQPEQPQPETAAQS